uniref:Copper transport protein n=1 Tax=Ciona savignyi TaxID=51511 RepID=H2Y8R4_CIOSA
MNHDHHMMSNGDHTMMQGHMNTTMMMKTARNSSMSAINHKHSAHDTSIHEEVHMTFYFGTNGVDILFEAWRVNSVGGMVGACIAVCLVAMLYEGLKVLRESLLKKYAAKEKYSNVNSNGVEPYVETIEPTVSKMLSKPHFIQTFLHLVQVMVSYALMLIFMTYNAYLAISIIFGAGLGYFLFGWKKAVIVDMNEHCH